jgi:hypothetical protein
MRKFFSYLVIASIFVLAFAAVRPALASAGGATGSGGDDTLFVKSISAAATYQRTWDWKIAKTGSVSNLLLSPGQTVPVNYAVTVTGAPLDSGWQASGRLAFRNTGAAAVTVTSVLVDLGGVVVTPTCSTPPGFPPVLNPGYTVECTYAAALPDGSPRTAVATIKTTGIPDGVSDSTPVVFGAPTSETGQCIDVDDTLAGSLGQVCASGNPTVVTFNYTHNVGPYAACGLYAVDNTATIRQSGKSARWTVNVDVPCAGSCTLTQGYWKTHSAQGPAPYDAAWKNIGALEEQTPFFLSGQTWIGVFNTAPAGNAYYTLAHQYMAAKLNVLDGASAPAGVSAALAQAEALFNANTPAQVTRTNRSEFNSLAALLDSYNNGLTGPGHCSQ